MIDSKQIAQRFQQAHQHYENNAVVQRKVAERLIGYMTEHIQVPHLPRVLEIGCGTGHFTQLFMNHYSIDHLFLNDLYSDVKQNFETDERLFWGIGDIEQMALPQSLDAVVSCSALQWIQNFNALMIKISQALLPYGYLCFASYAEDNLKEIKALTGLGLNYLCLEEIQQQLSVAGFDVCFSEQEQQQLMFKTPLDVLKHLKATGVQATAQGFRWTKSSLTAFEDGYSQFQDVETGQYRLTYHPIFIIAQKRT